MISHKQAGFTLLELMISLVLGLLIVAAGTAVFITGQRSLGLQGGMGELQQNANFGLGVLTHDLRHTNLNTPSTQTVNNKHVGSGIIFSVKNLPSSLSEVNVELLTKQNNNSDATTTGDTRNSDQLTIQFIPEYRKITKKKCPEADQPNCTDPEDVVTYEAKGNDCEGNLFKFSEVRTIVQRYSLKEDPVQVPGQPKAYSLYCAAGSYKEDSTEITGLTKEDGSLKSGQQLMQRIDAFKIRLGVKAPDKKLRYMTIDEYLAVMPDSVSVETDFYNVMSVEIGVIARSTTPLNSEKIDNKQTFDVVGNELTLNKEQEEGTKFLREVFSQVVAFRNTLGAS